MEIKPSEGNIWNSDKIFVDGFVYQKEREISQFELI